MKAIDHHALQERWRERMDRHARREVWRLRSAYALVILYLVAYALVVLMACFFCGAMDRPGITQMIIALYLIYGLVCRLFIVKEKTDTSAALKEEEYPLLYRLAKETAENVLDGKRLLIFVDEDIPARECSAAIHQEDDIMLLLGPMLLCILSEDELRQVLRHEFAHISNRDVKQTVFHDRLMSFLVGDGSDTYIPFASLALRFPMAYLSFVGQLYFIFSSVRKESQADEVAVTLQERQSFISALAKVHAHDLYLTEQEPYLSVYRSEQVPQNVITDRIHHFRRALYDREAFWRSIQENEIQSKSASHPIFRTRWEHMGECAYSLEPASLDGPFGAECWAVAKRADERLRRSMSESYETDRHQNYLKPLQIIREYEATGELGSPDTLRPVLLAYFQTGQPEKMEALCDRILAEIDNPFSTAFAQYWKGELMLYRYDKEGIDHLYQAMEIDPNYIMSGLDRIGSYCTRMGLEKELAHYRKYSVELIQHNMDRTTLGISAKASLGVEQLPDGWLDKILTYVIEEAKGTVSHVYLVKEQPENEYSPSAFVLRFREDADEVSAEEVYNKTFRLLDDWPGDHDFTLYVYEPSMEKVLSNVPGSCIYVFGE